MKFVEDWWARGAIRTCFPSSRNSMYFAVVHRCLHQELYNRQFSVVLCEFGLLWTYRRHLNCSTLFFSLSVIITVMKTLRYERHAAVHQSFTSAVNIGQKTKKRIKAFPNLKWHFLLLWEVMHSKWKFKSLNYELGI